jgi:DNA-binding response OmpR family regulator
MRVLLVDDEEELVSTMAQRLAIRGIDADWVTSGEDALKSAEAQQYDVAVLDVKMPRISGIELEKKLRLKHPDLKFIFLTGHGSEDDYIAGSTEAGSEFYMVKPVNIEFLIEKMNKVLGK